MSQLRLQMEQAAVQSYRAYYDVEEYRDAGPLKALCAYHSRSAQYVLVKKAELWSAETNEYVYLWSLPRLDEEALEMIFQKTLEDGMPRIHPHKDHMSTFLTAVVLCGEADPQTWARLKTLKQRKNFRLSLHGWMEFRIAAAVLDCGVFAANRPGRETAQFLEQLAQSVSQKSIKRGEEKLT